MRAEGPYLAISDCMLRRRIPLFAVVISAITSLMQLAVPAPPARAATLYPVRLTITGQGAIRFRMTAGLTVPSDSSASAKLFDGWFAPGEYTLLTPSVSICYQQTHGAFREIDWTAGTCTTAIVGRGRLAQPQHLFLTTD